MTLVIAVRGPDFVVTGSDSRGTYTDEAGNRIELNLFEKCHELNTRVSSLTFGDGETARFLLEGFRKEKDIGKWGPSRIVRELADYCQKNYGKAPKVTVGSVPKLGFIIAGLETPKSGEITTACMSVRSIDNFEPKLHDKYSIQGKPVIAHYLFRRQYEAAKSSVDGLTRLVAQALYDTSQIDGDVGGSFDVRIIDRDETRPVKQGDLPVLIEAWGKPVF